MITTVHRFPGDESQIPRTLHLEQLGLAHNFVERKGAVLTTHQRNRAKCPAVIAAFADFEIADVRQITSIDAYTRMEFFGYRSKQAALVQFRHELLHFRRAEEDIYFG